MPLRILHVIDGLGRGGAERLLVELANESARVGHEVHCCVTRTETTLGSELLPQVRLHVLGRKRRIDIGAMRRFRALAHAIDADVLHAHSRSTVSFLAATQIVAGRVPPIVFQDHFGGEGKLPWWFAQVGARVVQQYVAVAPRLARWALQSGYPAERLRVIGNRLSLQRLDSVALVPLRAVIGIRDGIPIGICVCGIREDKGVDVLVETMAEVTRRGLDVHVAVVGRDANRSFAEFARTLAAERGVADRIHFVGERPDAVGLMRGADFGIMPSRSESGPLVLIEYLAAGLPVVYTKTGEVADRAADLALDGVVPPDDHVALANAAERLVRTPEAGLVRRGHQSRSLAQAYFDIGEVLPEWEQVYASAASSGREER